jgi:hypothetical protein
MSVANLLAFIRERHKIHFRKESGAPWPWTEDPILREYRFCNVYRELDKETRLIHTNWLEPNANNIDLWFACIVARLVNWWPTLSAMKFPVPWDNVNFVCALENRKAKGEKVFTGAYMVRADANDVGSKAVYLANRVLSPIWAARVATAPRTGDSLDAFHARLMQHRDMGSFMAAQVVADAKHYDFYLKQAGDWGSWAAPGPGSLRGLNRVLGRPKDNTWRSKDWNIELFLLHNKVTSAVLKWGIPVIDAQNLQNCLCEFDKYERVRLGEGRPRSRYQPPKEALQ